MPDFDIDFCQDRRDEVIRYVQEKYGRDQVAQIITFGTLQARAVLRDVGRVLQMPYSQVDRLCKMVPQNPANPVSLAKAIEGEPRFAEEAEKEPIVQTLLDMAQKLEGLYRHASTHAAGIVIGDRPLSELVPMYRDPRSDMPVTQFNMKYVEQAGLVKFDFLGLKTLTVLDRAVKLIRRRGIEIDLAHIPLDDEKTYAMLSRGEVVGVFQVESAGMRKALIGMKPDRIEDIIALVALYRPGPMENIPTYNARKHGEEEIASIHPKIDHLVAETQGVIVYQEQVMQIAQELCRLFARRSRPAAPRHGQEDPRRDGPAARALRHRRRRTWRRQAAGRFHLRPAGEVRRLRLQQEPRGGLCDRLLPDRLSEGALSGRVPRRVDDARHVATPTSWPISARTPCRLGIDVVPPSVMTSFRDFEVGENRIFYSLAAIKGVGDAAVEHIVDRRRERPFASLADFCERIDPQIVGKRVLRKPDRRRCARLLRLRPRRHDGRRRAA